MLDLVFMLFFRKLSSFSLSRLLHTLFNGESEHTLASTTKSRHPGTVARVSSPGSVRARGLLPYLLSATFFSLSLSVFLFFFFFDFVVPPRGYYLRPGHATIGGTLDRMFCYPIDVVSRYAKTVSEYFVGDDYPRSCGQYRKKKKKNKAEY